MKAEASSGWPTVPRRWLALGAAAVVLVGGAAMLIGRQLVAPASAPQRPAASEQTGLAAGQPEAGGGSAGATAEQGQAAAEPEGFVRFRDAAAGLSIAYPSDWRRVDSRDPDIKLIAAHDDASVLVRTASIGVEVGPETIAAAKPLTDRLVHQAQQVRLSSRPAQVSLGGLPGYLYLYTFRDLTTGERGKHAHYFLFRRKTMITIVFQTVPAYRFPSVAQLFDEIGSTLRSEPSV